MVDSDLALERVLERLSPEAEARAAAPDWNAVRTRLSATQRTRAHGWRLAFAAVVALIAICLPAIALSASVRGWLGFGPQPVYNKARLVVSTPIAGNRIARVWISPSTDGGECEFLTIAPAALVVIDPKTGAMRPPTPRTRGSSQCTVGSKRVLPTGLTWTFGGITGGDPHAALINGHVGRTYKATRVEVLWNGGKGKVQFADGYFIGVVSMRNPAFARLPYDVVAYNAVGQAVVRSRIPTSFLYTDWKHVKSHLSQYRQSHGCSKEPARLWVCKKR